MTNGDITYRLVMTHPSDCVCIACEAASVIKKLRAELATADQEIKTLQNEQRVLVREINRVCQQDAVITDLRMLLEAQDQEITSLYQKLKGTHEHP